MSNKGAAGNAASSLNHSPVSLPPGSFDFDTLQQKLEHAAVAAPAKYDDAREKAVRDSVAETTSFGASAAREGYGFVEREHDEIEGLVETIQVYKPKPSQVVEPEPEPLVSTAPPVAQSTASQE